MTAVAGDFYEFVPIDGRRAGFLVADVSGPRRAGGARRVDDQGRHALGRRPAARRPGRGAARGCATRCHCHLRGQYVTAACLWLDTEARHRALLEPPGHPPLAPAGARRRTARRRASRANGHALRRGRGVRSHPTRRACSRSRPGDRLVLYTDGLTEAENASGEPFGDARLGAGPARAAGPRPAEEAVATRCWPRWRAWRAAARSPQQDDITRPGRSTCSTAEPPRGTWSQAGAVAA